MQLIYQGKAVELPAAPEGSISFVSVWQVPAGYIDEEFFVSVSGPGEPGSVPACSGSDAKLLLRMTLSQDDQSIELQAEGVDLE